MNAKATERRGLFSALASKLGMKPYMGEMRWNPVMSYMKRPDSKADLKKDESTDEAEK